MDGARCLRGDVRWDAARKGELPEQSPHTLGVLGDVGVDLRVRAVEVGVGHEARTAVAGAGDVDGRLLALLDRPVEMCVEEVEAGRRPPVTEQSGLDVVARQRGAEQWVVQQVDLTHGQVVRGAPPAVDLGKRFVAQFMSIRGIPGGRYSGHRTRSCGSGQDSSPIQLPKQSSCPAGNSCSPTGYPVTGLPACLSLVGRLQPGIGSSLCCEASRVPGGDAARMYSSRSGLARERWVRQIHAEWPFRVAVRRPSRPCRRDWWCCPRPSAHPRSGLRRTRTDPAARPARECAR